MNVPFASSTRSRIEASPDASGLEELAGLPGVEPDAVVGHLDAELAASGIDGHVDRARAGVLGGVRQRLLDDAVRKRLEVARDLGGGRTAELRPHVVVAAVPVEGLAERRDETPLLEQRRSQPGHEAPQVVRLLRQLTSDLREHLEPLAHVPRLQHQQDGLQGEGGRRHALHGSVVQVASDPVALALDRRVGPAHDPRAVLVAVLQELEERSDRLVGHARGRHVANEQQPAGRVARDLRGAGLQIDRVALAVQGSLSRRGQLGEAVVRLDRRGDRGPWLALDERLRHLEHLAERLVGSKDEVLVIELDDPVDRGLEHRPQAFFGFAKGLVRALEAAERLVGLAERGFLLIERHVHRALGVGPADLVHEDAEGDRRGEHPDQHRGLQRIDRSVDLLHRHQPEGAAGGGDREAREDRAPVARRLHLRFGGSPRHRRHERRDEQAGQRERQVDVRLPQHEVARDPLLRERDQGRAHGRDRDEHPDVSRVGKRQRQRAEPGEAGRRDERETRRRRGLHAGGAVRPQVQEQHGSDRRAEQGDVGGDLTPVLPSDVVTELDRHGDEEHRRHDHEGRLVDAGS